ncbi:MAG: hypothetical protein RLZZ436_3931 [Planctomycetota bacterium]|jgi:ATP-dependent Clp protease ATP-binding subunit ClpA
MDITIPVYVETVAVSGGRPEYLVRPLWFDAPVEQAPLLSTALQKLTKSVRKQLVELSRQQRHDALAAWSSNPELETHQYRIRIERDSSIIRLRLLLIILKRFQRRLAFTPAFPEMWFEVLADEDPEQRLAEALTAHLKILAGEGRGIDTDSLRRRSLETSAWVTDIQLTLTPERVRVAKSNNLFAMLGSAERMNGEWELHRVGRCLQDLYPHDLSRAQLREREVQELTQVLSSTDRRPVLLLGRRQCGKTAVLHEYVFRNAERPRSALHSGGAVWLLSPQRLISGMSYVGQWESRFHAIMQFAARRDLVMYFDDLVGLFQAGVTSQSSISAAALLKTIMLNRTVRICGELTFEEFRVLQERDRAFADQFHVIRVQELMEAENLRVLLGWQRQLEVRHSVRFQLETLPAIIDLQRRYVRDAAFPGKAAAFMQRLAVRFGAESRDSGVDHHRRPLISQDSVFEMFRQQSGLPLSFLDQRTRLQSGQITAAIRERFVGQPQAVGAAVEIISIARARLNDPSRPLATLLLLGPTGVGKTEFARSLASCLFGSADRLLRFDMNEFVSPTAVSLLAGTFTQPDGLLTAAVRRQPFAVLLFDEIEKAHPNVFDLLLQVLGEGRLTDARGRTTNFSNTIIVLTSNLGTQRNEHSLGFGVGSDSAGQQAVRAAEQFFRPEFFNRIDRVVPFDRLSRVDVELIARHLMTGVLQREGLIRRQCILNASPAVTEWIVEQGFNPVLGARALKRAIERELAQPVAALLAELPAESATSTAPEAVTLLDVDRGEAGLTVAVRRLQYRAVLQPLQGDSADSTLRTLAECDRILVEIEERLPQLRTTGVFETSALTPAQCRYLMVQDELLVLRERHEEIRVAVTSRKANNSAQVLHIPRPSPTVVRRFYSWPDTRNPVAQTQEAIDDFVHEPHLQVPRALAKLPRPEDLRARCSWLRKLAFSELCRMEEDVTLRVTVMDPGRAECLRAWIAWFYSAWHGSEDGINWGLELDVQQHPDTPQTAAVRIQGVLAGDVADRECGFQLFELEDQPAPGLLSVSRPTESPPEVLVRRLKIISRTKGILAPTISELHRQTWGSVPD